MRYPRKLINMMSTSLSPKIRRWHLPITWKLCVGGTGISSIIQLKREFTLLFWEFFESAVLYARGFVIISQSSNKTIFGMWGLMEMLLIKRVPMICCPDLDPFYLSRVQSTFNLSCFFRFIDPFHFICVIIFTLLIMVIVISFISIDNGSPLTWSGVWPAFPSPHSPTWPFSAKARAPFSGYTTVRVVYE